MDTSGLAICLSVCGSTEPSNTVCLAHTVLRRGLSIGLLLVVLSGGAIAQEFFAVRNQKKQKWPVEDANRIYLLASEAVEREFKLSRPVRPRFTLVLGYEGNQLDVNTGELRLAKWDRKVFADGVILFCMEQMLTPEIHGQLLRRTLLAADATVGVEEELARSDRGSGAAPISAANASHDAGKQ
jgi:hypothetical protein